MMAMRYLAEHFDEGPQSAKDIARSYRIPLPVLAKTLSTLARAALVTSQHGAAGGYILARSAHAISAFEIISAFDGPPVITGCSTAHGKCDMVTHCRVMEPLKRVNESIRMLLCNITVADLTNTSDQSRSARDEPLVSIL